jgi:hypothetical protein
MTVATVPSTIQIKRRHLLGLVLAVAALAAALTWATLSIVGDDHTDDGGAPAAPAAAVVASAHAVAVEDRPIHVANAYHGVGVMFCLDDRQPVTVADTYHGVGVTVCV